MCTSWISFWLFESVVSCQVPIMFGYCQPRLLTLCTISYMHSFSSQYHRSRPLHLEIKTLQIIYDGCTPSIRMNVKIRVHDQLLHACGKPLLEVMKKLYQLVVWSNLAKKQGIIPPYPYIWNQPEHFQTWHYLPC